MGEDFTLWNIEIDPYFEGWIQGFQRGYVAKIQPFSNDQILAKTNFSNK